LCWAMYGQTVHSGQSANCVVGIWERPNTYLLLPALAHESACRNRPSPRHRRD
jgi:hypothetical protein